ncbi:hypothetical protein KAR91_08615, partial [Candidatus Pacearchaeota archaeon]|nr:hypothetical protein [Candidatus Pacearchaeota archaeon]
MYEDIINDGTKRGFMAIGKFYNLPEYKRTRDWVSRSPKTAKNLNKGWLPPHGEVNLIQYPDGSITVLNGHTRRYCWMNDMAPAPTKVRYTLYILDKDNPDEHAKNLYY